MYYKSSNAHYPHDRISVPLDYTYSDPRWSRFSRQASAWTSFYLYMLHSDITNHLLPYSTTPYGYGVEVEPSNSEEICRTLALALARERRFSTLPEALRDFMTEAAETLLTQRYAVYEVIHLSASPLDSQRQPASLEFSQIHPASLRRRMGRWRQYIPVDSQWRWLGRSIKLDQDRLLVVTLGKRMHRELVSLASTLAALAPSMLARTTMLKMSRTEGFSYDFDQHQAELDLYLARSTSSIGWNARGLLEKYETEPYRLWRDIRFSEFKIQLRDLILQAINDALVHVHKRTGLAAQLRLTGVPTMQDMEQLRIGLMNGEIGAAEISRRLFRM